MRKRKILAIFLVIFTVLLTSFTFYTWQMLYAPNILVDQEDRYVYISEDDTFSDLQDRFYDARVVGDLLSFSFLARLMDYDKLVKPGKFLLKKNMSNLAAIRLLRSGEQEPVSITFNNVRLISDLGEKITQGIAINAEDFNAALDRFLADNDEGWNRENIIAMFIPNTYSVYWTISGDELVARMNREYEVFWNEERRAKAEALGLTPREVSVLASIVQAESVKKDESRTIAGLYVNRLEQGIRLQADPTLVFAVGDFSLIRVLNEHKEVDSPYNTYKYKGLPPGPINMPNIHSIDAVLNYEKHNYIYMVAKEDFSGYHNFATNYSDHIRNARRYQRQLTIEQRKARQNQSN